MRTTGSFIAFMAMALPASAAAQSLGVKAPEQPAAPIVDENSVQIPSDYITVQVPVLGIGGAEPFSVSLVNYPSGYDSGGRPPTCEGSACISEQYLRSGFYPQRNLQTSLEGGLSFPEPSQISHRLISFSYGGINETFHESGLASASRNGGELVKLSPSQWRYTDRNGTVYEIGGSTWITVSGADLPVVKITYPNGRIVDLTYRQLGTSGKWRLQDVRDNYGFFVKPEYDSDTYAASNQMASLWARRIEAGNLAYDTCAPTVTACSPVNSIVANNSWNTDGTQLTVTSAGGASTVFRQNYYWEIVGIKPAGSSTETITYEMCGRKGGDLCTGLSSCDGGFGPGLPACLTWVTFPGKVHRAFANSETTQYASTVQAGGYVLATSFNNDYRGNRTLLQRDHPFDSTQRGQYMQLTHYDGTQYGYQGDDTNRVTAVMQNDMRTRFAYDDRGNITSVTEEALDGSVSRTSTYTFPATCTNRKVCNKPTRVTDPKGQATDLAYDPNHGGLVSKTLPPDRNGVRAQVRYTYAQRYAWFRNNSGTVVRAPSPIWVLTGQNTCRTSAWTGTACAAGANDEIRTVFDYGPASGINNLLLRGVAVTASGETLRTCYTYDKLARKIAETAPGANLGQCA